MISQGTPTVSYTNLRNDLVVRKRKTKTRSKLVIYVQLESRLIGAKCSAFH